MDDKKVSGKAHFFIKVRLKNDYFCFFAQFKKRVWVSLSACWNQYCNCCSATFSPCTTTLPFAAFSDDAAGIIPTAGAAKVETAAGALDAFYSARSLTIFADGNKPSCFKVSTLASITLPDFVLTVICGCALNFSPSS